MQNRKNKYFIFLTTMLSVFILLTVGCSPADNLDDGQGKNINRENPKSDLRTILKNYSENLNKRDIPDSENLCVWITFYSVNGKNFVSFNNGWFAPFYDDNSEQCFKYKVNYMNREVFIIDHKTKPLGTALVKSIDNKTSIDCIYSDRPISAPHLNPDYSEVVWEYEVVGKELHLLSKHDRQSSQMK